MPEVGMYEAKTHFPKLVERVQKGETITITKHGVPVAVLAPAAETGRLTSGEAIDALREFRKRFLGRGLSPDEIKRLKHEGHKY